MNLRKSIVFSIITLISLTSCNSFPPDDSPAWPKNNRFAVEMENNCNLATHSIGISGCAFKSKLAPGAFVKFPSFWPSAIDIISARCGNKSYRLGKNKFLQLELFKIQKDNQNCSFAITRKVTDVADDDADYKMIGRFFIKIIPDNKFYRLMNFEMGSNQFKGVGWYQRKEQEIAPPLTIYPLGSEGVILIKCAEETVSKVEFASKPVLIEMPEGKTCDYEISVINDDSPLIEFGTLVYEESKYTEDIKLPKTYIRKKHIYFNFDDTRNNDAKKSVVAAKINDFYCTSPVCGVRTGQSVYTIRAVTASLRFFYGEYYPEEDRWEVK